MFFYPPPLARPTTISFLKISSPPQQKKKTDNFLLPFLGTRGRDYLLKQVYNDCEANNLIAICGTPHTSNH